LVGKSTPVLLLQKCFHPLGLNLTHFRPANPVIFNLNITGFSRKSILTTQKEKIQDIFVVPFGTGKLCYHFNALGPCFAAIKNGKVLNND
jgi:hypothetical protein